MGVARPIFFYIQSKMVNEIASLCTVYYTRVMRMSRIGKQKHVLFQNRKDFLIKERLYVQFIKTFVELCTLTNWELIPGKEKQPI